MNRLTRVRLEIGNLHGPGNYIGVLLDIELKTTPTGWTADCIEPGVYTDGPGVWHGEGETTTAAILDLLAQRLGRKADGTWL